MAVFIDRNTMLLLQIKRVVSAVVSAVFGVTRSSSAKHCNRNGRVDGVAHCPQMQQMPYDVKHTANHLIELRPKPPKRDAAAQTLMPCAGCTPGRVGSEGD